VADREDPSAAAPRAAAPLPGARVLQRFRGDL